MKKIKKCDESFFKTKKATALFSLISLIGGVFFFKYKATGNVILRSDYSFNIFPLVGLLLFLCSIILGVYTIKNPKNR